MKNKQSMISVIMSVYNSEKYLKESIESILTQTYKNFEFIIIDDGSTDNSLNVISQYKKEDNRIKVITRENRGLVYSLNEGIALAKGEYIARMDGDDISINYRLEKQLSFLEENEDISILGSSIYVFGNRDIEQMGKSEKWFEQKLAQQDLEKIFLHACAIPHPTIMMRKSIFNVLKGYKDDFKTAEDYDLWLRAIKNGLKIAKLDDKLLRYRVHDTSKTSKEESNFFMLEFVIKAKLNYLNSTLENKRNYIIWGASNGGNKTYEIIKQKYSRSNLVAWVDKFKKGRFNNINIIKPEEVNSLNFDYIFIATTPGKTEAENYLENLGYKFKEDYCYII